MGFAYRELILFLLRDRKQRHDVAKVRYFSVCTCGFPAHSCQFYLLFADVGRSHFKRRCRFQASLEIKAMSIFVKLAKAKT